MRNGISPTVTITLEEYKTLIEKALVFDIMQEQAETRAENGYYISDLESTLYGIATKSITTKKGE